MSKYALGAKHVAGCCMASLVMLAPLMAACADNMKTIRWKEETKLASGNTIIVERTETFRLVYAKYADAQPYWGQNRFEPRIIK